MQKGEIGKFQKTVWDFYTENRRDLPWRPLAREGRGAQAPARNIRTY